ncbi:zeta toxin family protein [Ahrensia sp. 13_GOM-1096m]|uniref:zeta toxin family protein n=1 Tax=Ahrensia sp. 13_GOM-1096m TaxID=1380380 RepID=UPI000688DDD2|nr:zeta toxin family protein [Ahrensia sp. 13_GOM-1096m]
MAFDPFNDFETRGYLRNHAGVKDPAIVRRLEHNAFAGNILRALDALQNAPEVNLESVRDTHRILFSDVYPWAGQDRSQNAAHLAIGKGDIDFQFAPYVPRGVGHALSNANNQETFRNDPGKIIGELAYAHPFLEGNGRTITAIASELARRSGFHIAWEETNKSDYLKALTAELDQPDKDHLTKYLRPFIREGELQLDQSANQLRRLPGFNRSGPTLDREPTPILTIIAGPNGAGKSTLMAASQWLGQPVIDSDAAARSLNPTNPEALGTKVGKRASELGKEYLDSKRSFAVETTLSGNSIYGLIDMARDNGFRVDLKYIGLHSPELARARVEARVAMGGRDIPDEDLQRRYRRSMEQLPTIMTKVDHTQLLDNSSHEAFRKVADISRDRAEFFDAPLWASKAGFEAAQSELGKAETVTEIKRASEKALSVANAGGVSDNQLKTVTRNLERAQTRSLKNDGYDL